jgi:hypothetical protein
MLNDKGKSNSEAVGRRVLRTVLAKRQFRGEGWTAAPFRWGSASNGSNFRR